MVGFNNLIMLYYQPRVFFEQVDGKTVMVIWVTAGERHPYKVPDLITAKEKKYNYYVCYNSSTIVTKGDNLAKLMIFSARRGEHHARPDRNYQLWRCRAKY